MKKLSFFLLSLVLGLTSFSFAAKQTVDIKEIKLRYCNGTGASTKSLFLETKPTLQEDICMEFSNEGSVGATIGVNFVDGALTADADQKKACLPEGEKKQFGQYVTGYESQLYLPPRGMVRTYAKITFPAGYAGASYGCVTYFLPDAKKDTIEQSGKMFEIFARVGSFVDVFVNGKIVPELITIPVQSDLYDDIGSNENVMIYKHDDRYYSAKTNIFNTGNIAVSGDITMGWSTRWGLLSSSKTLTGQSILPQQFQVVDVDLPWYLTRLVGGPTIVKVDVSYSPIYLGAFNTNVSNEQYVLTDTNSYVFFPRVIILLLIILVGIHIKVRHSTLSKKVIHAPSSGPTTVKKKTTQKDSLIATKPRTRKKSVS